MGRQLHYFHYISISVDRIIVLVSTVPLFVISVSWCCSQVNVDNDVIKAESGSYPSDTKHLHPILGLHQDYESHPSANEATKSPNGMSVSSVSDEPVMHQLTGVLDTISDEFEDIAGGMKHINVVDDSDAHGIPSDGQSFLKGESYNVQATRAGDTGGKLAPSVGVTAVSLVFSLTLIDI